MLEGNFFQSSLGSGNQEKNLSNPSLHLLLNIRTKTPQAKLAAKKRGFKRSGRGGGRDFRPFPKKVEFVSIFDNQRENKETIIPVKFCMYIYTYTPMYCTFWRKITLYGFEKRGFFNGKHVLIWFFLKRNSPNPRCHFFYKQPKLFLFWFFVFEVIIDGFLNGILTFLTQSIWALFPVYNVHWDRNTQSQWDIISKKSFYGPFFLQKTRVSCF